MRGIIKASADRLRTDECTLSGPHEDDSLSALNFLCVLSFVKVTSGIKATKLGGGAGKLPLSIVKTLKKNLLNNSPI